MFLLAGAAARRSLARASVLPAGRAQLFTVAWNNGGEERSSSLAGAALALLAPAPAPSQPRL